MALQKYRGRFAPSPTGPLHLGNALTAYLAADRARGGEFILRSEDLDRPRVQAGREAEQFDDLRWLGIVFSESPQIGGRYAPYRQSQRQTFYVQALEQLFAAGLAYYCTCSRRQIELLNAEQRAISAPHGASDDGPRYPGTCRGNSEKPSGRYAIRLTVSDEIVSFDDGFCGPYQQNVSAAIGDFVIARAEAGQTLVIAYQLAVVVDDIAMAISEVVRGGDLLTSTPRQILLYRALGATAPAFAHGPLVLGANGQKLNKRAPEQTLAGLRAAGVSANRLRQFLLLSIPNKAWFSYLRAGNDLRHLIGVDRP